MNIRLDLKSLAATLFLVASLYVLARAGQGSPINAIIEILFIIAIIACLYFSYRLIMAIGRMPG